MPNKDVDFKEFDGSLDVQYSKLAFEELGKHYWVVKKAFSMDLGIDRRVYIPKGYLSDGASVPGVFQRLIPPWGKYSQAAVMHDWLCEYLLIWDDNLEDWISISRSDCDALFNTGMRILRVKKSLRVVMFNAVRAYGHLASIVYKSYDPKKAEVERRLLEHYSETGVWL